MKKKIGIICLVIALISFIMKLNIIITIPIALLGIVLIVFGVRKKHGNQDGNI